MAKKPAKRNDTETRKLTTKVEQLRARLKKAEAANAKWKATAKRLEAEVSKQSRQVKKLTKRFAQSRGDASTPQTVATVDAPSSVSVPDESWTVTRLRAAAREAGVVGYSRKTKAELIEELTQGSAPRD